jgi:hypothetical protein
VLSREFQHMDAGEIGRNRGLWRSIPRAQALSESRTHTVAVIHRGLGRDTATLFQPSNRFFRANGPYLYDGLRYFLYIGPGGGDTRLNHSLGMASKPPEAELEPLEFEDQATGEFRSLGSPVKKKLEPHPIEFQLVDAAGKAIADAEYEVILPDGSVRRGSTRADGFVRITDNMHKGEARLTLKLKHSHKSADASSGAASVSGAAAVPEPDDVAGEFSLAALLDLKPEIPEIPALPVIPLPVEILLTDADGLPMPNTAFKARFPDGTVVSGDSDQAGLIRFPDNIQAGEIVLTLPGLAKAA